MLNDREIVSECFLDAMKYVPDCMIVVDRLGRVLIANDRTFEVFGYSKNELLSKELSVLLPEYIRKRHSENIKEFFANPETRKMGSGLELVGLKKSGELIDIDVSLGPINTKKGIMAVAVIRNVSDLKQKQRKLDRYAKKLEGLTEGLNKFSYLVSHDLKAPLGRIKAIVGIIKSRIVDNNTEDVIQYAEMMNDCVVHMTDTINGILEYSRASLARSPIEKLNLTDLVNEWIKYIQIPENIKINIHALPVVEGEKIKFQQIFTNLISNALKYNDKEKGVIEVGVEEKESVFEFYIKDNGPGIKEEERDNIFNLFYQLENRKDSHGIGLSIIKKIINDNGGSIWVEDNEIDGEGTIFKFTWSKNN